MSPASPDRPGRRSREDRCRHDRVRRSIAGSGALSKQNCVTTSTRVAGPPSPVAPRLEPVQRVRQFEKRMAFGMTGHADGRDPVRLDQSAGADIARRFERALRRGDIARDQKNARDIGLAPGPRQEIIERFPRRHFARRDMRHRIEAGAAQRGRGLNVVAIIVAGQERDGDISAGSEIVAQFRDLMPARGDFDRRRRQQRGESWRMPDRRRSRPSPKFRPARGGARSHRFRR